MPINRESRVFSKKYDFLKGKEAWRSNLNLTALTAEKIRSSLGPNGAYKMVTYNRGPEKIVKITKDAVAVLEELAMQYPTVSVLAEAAKMQRRDLGDGVKSFVIFTCALLKKADELMAKRIHPTVILHGYEEAAKKTQEIISVNSQPLNDDRIEEVLEAVDCGRDCLNKDLRAQVVQASTIASNEGKLDKGKIRIVQKPGGSQPETRLFRGIIIKKERLHPNMPDRIIEPKIAVISQRIGSGRLEVKMPSQGPIHMKFDIVDSQKLAEYRETEKQIKTSSVEKLIEFGVNVLFSQQPIDTFTKSKLLRMGVLAFESVDRSDLTLICKASGAKMVGNLDELSASDVGKAEVLETDKIGLEKIVMLALNDYATFLIRGSNLQIIDELELTIENALRLLQTANSKVRVIQGGGMAEVRIARQLKEFALQFSGREQLAVDGFAEALLEIPRCLAANNGQNPDDMLVQLANYQSQNSVDWDANSDDCPKEYCPDVSEVKSAVVRRAFEVASLMLRIDEQIISKEIPKFHKK